MGREITSNNKSLCLPAKQSCDAFKALFNFSENVQGQHTMREVH